jgi:AcrR family transcriptional regulator
MTRTADPNRPIEILDAIIVYLAKHGLADLSLRPLAKAVHSSPRVLLYYFGSKEELVARAIKRIRERQRTGFAQMRNAKYGQPSDLCRAIWKQMSSPEFEPAFKLSVETYALALRHRKQFADFLSTSIEDWLLFLSEPLIAKGISKIQARAFATIIIAGFRGFMLDFCASRDHARIDRAVDLWLQSLDSISPAEDLHVQ